MPKLFFWSTNTKIINPFPLSPASPVLESDSKPNHADSQKHTPSLALKDDSPTRKPSTPPYLFGRPSSEIPKTLDTGRSCSPGTTMERDSPIRRIYMVTNADDQDAQLSPRHILPKYTAFDPEEVRKSRTESHSPRGDHRIPPVRLEPTLPHGWERRKTRNGKVFYIDHNTRTTTFHPPLIEPEGNPDALGPLPPWWEMKVLDDGRIVFLDHKTQTTTLRDPRKLKLRETPLAQFIRKALYLQRVMRHERLPGQVEIKVRKSHVFEDSFNAISSAMVDNLRKDLSVVVEGLPPVHHTT